MNKYLNTVTIAAMTGVKPYPARIDCTFRKRNGQVALDQIRSLDKVRFLKKLGSIDKTTCKTVCDVLAELFKL